MKTQAETFAMLAYHDAIICGYSVEQAVARALSVYETYELPWME